MHIKVLRPNFEKRGGLIPAVAQDAETEEVLMVAYVDEAAWRETLKTGFATYYSTTRACQWVKGEESGNLQRVRHILVNCHGDSLVYLVEPEGAGVACHTGARSCFYRSVIPNVVPDDPAPKAGEADQLPLVDAFVLRALAE